MSTDPLQVTLTPAQRDALERRAIREGRTVAELVQDAIDHYLVRGDASLVNAASSRTYGALPDLDLPSRTEWNRPDM